MPNDTSFSSKWLQKTDSTSKPCSIWLHVKAIFSINILFHICRNLYKVRMPVVDTNILLA